MPSDVDKSSPTLREVQRVIPASAYERPTRRGMAYFGRDAALYIVLMALLVRVSHPLLAIPLVVATTFTVAGLFVIAHDCAHGSLFESNRLNAIVGRVAMLPSLHVFDAWILGHNRIHHRFTARQGMDFVWHPSTPEEYAMMGRWQRLQHRVEWSAVGAGLYYGRRVWWQLMVSGNPPARAARGIRRDRLLVLGYAIVAGALFGTLGWVTTGTVAGTLWLVTRALVLPFLGFLIGIGILVHLHHVGIDLPWRRSSEWNSYVGQVEATKTFRCSPVFDFFLHWIMVHVAHHVDMRIPMYNLGMATEAIAAAYPGAVREERLRWSTYLSNVRACKLYDFDERRWMTYRDALSIQPNADCRPVVRPITEQRSEAVG